MNAQKKLIGSGDECCQPPSPRLRRSGCENVASANTNFQYACAMVASNKLGIGNNGIGNTSTMATFSRLPAALKHGGK